MQQEVDRLWRTDVRQLRQLLSTYHIDYAPSDERKSLIWKFLSVMRPESRVQLHMYLDFLEGLGNTEEARNSSGGEEQQPSSKPSSNTGENKYNTEPNPEDGPDGYQWYEAWMRHLREQQQELPRQPPAPEVPGPGGRRPSWGPRGPRGGPADPQPPYPGGPQGDSASHSQPYPHVIPPYEGQFPRRPPPQPPPPVPKVPDYYAMLEVSLGCEASAIKRAYRRLAMRYHPDKNPGNATAEERFKAVKQAYEVLTDDDQRGRYDAALGRYLDWVKADLQYRAEAQYQLQFQAMLANPIVPLTAKGAAFPAQPFFGDPLRQATPLWHPSSAPRPKPHHVPHAWSDPASAFAGATDSSRSRNSDPGKPTAGTWQAPPPRKTSSTCGAQSSRLDPQEAYRVPDSSPATPASAEPCQPRSRRMRTHSKATGAPDEEPDTPLAAPAVGQWRPHFRHSPNASVASTEGEPEGRGTAAPSPEPVPASPTESPPSPRQDPAPRPDGPEPNTSPRRPRPAEPLPSPAPAVSSVQGRRSRVGPVPIRLEAPPAGGGAGDCATEASPRPDPLGPTGAAAPAAPPPPHPIARPSKFRSLLNRFGLPFAA